RLFICYQLKELRYFYSTVRFLLLISLSIAIQAFTQDIKGTWKGKLFQEPDREYYFEIRVDEVNSTGELKGTTFVKEEVSGNFGTITFTGTYKKPLFIFNEIEIVGQDKENQGGYYASN